LQERADTTQAALAGRQALAARLAEFKAIRNVDPYVGAGPAQRGGGLAGVFGRLAGGRAGSGDMPDDEDGSGYGTTAAKVIGGRGAANEACCQRFPRGSNRPTDSSPGRAFHEADQRMASQSAGGSWRIA
jgi:hypothetical protein